MISRREQVGFSQRIRLEWFERTANLVLAGNDRAATEEALQAFLKDKVSIEGKAVRGNREKVITILMKTWLNVPRELEALRREGLELLRRLPQEERMAVHWGMIMAVYPFWAAVATQVGRLLKLQGSVVAAQVQRRLRERYGERETVSRATRRVLRSYVDWGVLQETRIRGIYKQGLSITIADPKLASWLLEAALHTCPNRMAPLQELRESVSLFPFLFQWMPTANLAAASPRLEIFRQGLDMDLLMLREEA